MSQAVDTKLLEAMAEHALVGLVAFDKESNKVMYANTKAKEILNLNGNIESFEVSHLVPQDVKNDKFRQLSVELLEHEGLFQDMLIRKSTGEHFVGSCGVRHLDVDSKHYTLLMLQDTTLQAKMAREIENKQMQIKTAYEELLQQNKQLKELDIAKTRFIALVTHELRTPTSAVVASSEMLKLGIYDDEAQMKEFIGMIHDEGKHLLELINDILDFAKIQSGRMDYYIEQLDVTKVLDHATESLSQLAEKSNIELKYTKPENDTLCFYDQHRLQQVVTNLLSNGIKYNNEGGQVEVYVETIDKTVRVHIKDNGNGISDENQALIFNEFETLGKMSSHQKGTGLGLPISKRMIEAMGGTIGLNSEEGKGSDFWIDIPMEKVLDDPEIYRSRADDGIEDLAA